MAGDVAGHAADISLPSLVAVRLGREIFGAPYVIYPWIAYMEQRVIEAILDETHERIIVINAPPQTGKSSYIGLFLPFWLTGMFPHKKLMYLSYSDDFSEAKGKEVRALHYQYGKDLFGSEIDTTFDTGKMWRLKGSSGGMLSAGIGGRITGNPGDIILIDDLLKNAEEARSEATKRTHIGEWDGTIARRMQPGTTIIIIATRWAEDDLSGTLRERVASPDYDGPEIEFIEFPAFAEPESDVDLTPEEENVWRDVLNREYGEVLDCRFSRIPGREPRNFFEKVKSSMDPYAWEAMYQQHPSIREGGLFPKDKWVYEKRETWPVMQEIVRVWDLAATEGGGDFTVGTKVGRGSDGRFYVMDIQRFRKGAGGVQEAIAQRAEIDGFTCAIQIEEEKGGSGKTSTEFFKRMLPMFNVTAAKAEGDKVSRVMPGAAMQNNSMVVLDPDDPWVPGFVLETSKLMADGRGPKNDDQIDTYGYAMMKLVGRSGVSLYIPGQTPDLGGGGGDMDWDQEGGGQYAERILTRNPVVVGGQPFYG